MSAGKKLLGCSIKILHASGSKRKKVNLKKLMFFWKFKGLVLLLVKNKF